MMGEASHKVNKSQKHKDQALKTFKMMKEKRDNVRKADPRTRMTGAAAPAVTARLTARVSSLEGEDDRGESLAKDSSASMVSVEVL
jgi:hypothetical protein